MSCHRCLFSWGKNCLRNINKFPKWKFLYKAIPNWDIYHSFYNSDVQIHKWHNKFWGSYSTCSSFSPCSQRSLLTTVSSTWVQRTELYFDLWEKSNFRTTKKTKYCFLLPLPNTYICLWFDVMKLQSLVLLLLLLLLNWIFPKDSFFVKCHTTWCRESFTRAVPFSAQMTYAGMDKIAERMSLQAWRWRYVIIVFVHSLNFLGNLQGFCLSVSIYKTGKAWLFTCLLTRKLLSTSIAIQELWLGQGQLGGNNSV